MEQSNHKLKTGFVGTPLLNNVLTDNGMNDLAYELLLNEEFPGWLYEVKLGATTVWERWNSLLADGTISGISMNSMNHYAYGSIQEWMFRHVAGINTMDSHPGVKTVQFAPTLNWDLRYAEAKYDSASGMYGIRWELSDKEHVNITMDVPFDCTAEAVLPLAAESEKEAIAKVLGAEENGRYLLMPGHYEVSYQLSRRMGKNYSLDTPLRVLLQDKEAKAILEQNLPGMDIPEQYKDASLKKMAANFGDRIPEEKVEAVRTALEELSK